MLQCSPAQTLLALLLRYLHVTCKILCKKEPKRLLGSRTRKEFRSEIGFRKRNLYYFQRLHKTQIRTNRMEKKVVSLGNFFPFFVFVYNFFKNIFVVLFSLVPVYMFYFSLFIYFCLFLQPFLCFYLCLFLCLSLSLYFLQLFLCFSLYFFLFIFCSSLSAFSLCLFLCLFLCLSFYF